MPDLAAYGKVVAGGFPLACVAGPRIIMRHSDAALEGHRPLHAHEWLRDGVAVDLHRTLYGVGAGRYRVTYRGGNSCTVGQMTDVASWNWADYGDGHFQNFSDEGKAWVCQYRQPPSDGSNCVTDIIFDYDDETGAVTGAGRDDCLWRVHDAACPNLHQYNPPR